MIIEKFLQNPTIEKTNTSASYIVVECFQQPFVLLAYANVGQLYPFGVTFDWNAGVIQFTVDCLCFVAIVCGLIG